MSSRKLPLAVAAALAALGAGASAAHAQAPIPVFNPADAGAGTLRQAINRANNNANLSIIEFNLPAAGTVIAPNANLPAITAPVEIDGYSQPGSSPASAAIPAVPGAVIDAVNTTQALALNTSNSLIQGLAIHDSSGAMAGPDGIQIAGNANRIEGNHIGTSAAGTTKGMWNLATGVAILAGQGNVVGGSLPEDANVIAEVDGDGVAIAANANTVVGNRLGLPYGGGLGNHVNGISVTGNDNRIGKTSAGGRNVISANNDHGVLISGNGNAVEGNYVGLDENGASGPGNILDGVHIVGSQNLVRGNAAGLNGAGVALDGSNNSVIANTLGTAAASNDDGVLVLGGNTNVVGGDEEDERNVISGNNDSGVDIEGGQNHRVEGNRIGTDADGVAAVANGNGVSVESSFNVVADNLLSGNNDAGVMLDGDGVGPPPIGNTVERNVIGLDAGGSAALPNEYGVVVEDSHRNAITDNVISDNTGHGVLIDSFDLANTDGNWLTGNTISDNGLSGVRDRRRRRQLRRHAGPQGQHDHRQRPGRRRRRLRTGQRRRKQLDLRQRRPRDRPRRRRADRERRSGRPRRRGERPPEPPDHHRPRARSRGPARVPVRGLRIGDHLDAAQRSGERLPARVLPQRDLRRPWRGQGAARHATGDDRRQRSRGGHGPALACGRGEGDGDCDARPTPTACCSAPPRSSAPAADLTRQALR